MVKKSARETCRRPSFSETRVVFYPSNVNTHSNTHKSSIPCGYYSTDIWRRAADHLTQICDSSACLGTAVNASDVMVHKRLSQNKKLDTITFLLIRTGFCLFYLTWWCVSAISAVSRYRRPSFSFSMFMFWHTHNSLKSNVA